MIALHCVRQLGVLTCLLSLIGCSNGRGSLENAEATPGSGGFSVGGSVNGLTGAGLVLQNNGGNDLTVAANGAYVFAASLADGTSYNVTVLSQPSNPAQICTVANGSGSIAGGNVTNIGVTCATGTFAVAGTVTGLLGSGLVLQNNGGDDLAVAADGSFSFAAPLATGAGYTVTVRTQPSTPSQTCTIANSTGTVGSADVTNIAVTCVTGGFSISGAVSGLVGSGLVLQNNGGDDLAIVASGNFVFAGQVASGASYNVTVRSQPTSPSQTCSVANPAGTLGGEGVSNITVACATNVFTVGGTATGLAGAGLVLQLNDGNDRAITTNGSFAFPNAVPSGTPYVVSVKTQPSNPSQTCAVANATGVVPGGNVTNVTVSCTTSVFTIGGTVTGLRGAGLVLQLNGGADLAIASNGSFTFETQQASGTPYQVTVSAQPRSEEHTSELQSPI